MREQNESIIQWLLGFLFTAVISSFTVVTYAYSTFATHAEVEYKDQTQKAQIAEIKTQLIRIEDKIDHLKNDSRTKSKN